MKLQIIKSNIAQYLKMAETKWERRERGEKKMKLKEGRNNKSKGKNWNGYRVCKNIIENRNKKKEKNENKISKIISIKKIKVTQRTSAFFSFRWNGWGFLIIIDLAMSWLIDWLILTTFQTVYVYFMSRGKEIAFIVYLHFCKVDS